MSIKSIKVISRNPDHYMRETKHDLYKVPRNYDPKLHPFQSAREYKLAQNAVKLERTFAKPFIGSLMHSESVSSICRHPQRLSSIFTGTVEGELCLWNLQSKHCEWKIQAHHGEVHCICAAPNGESFYTVGNDKTINKWSVAGCLEEHSNDPVDTWLSEDIITGISHHYGKNEFITCGERVLLWDASAKAPKSSFDWSTSGDRHEASVVCVKFNPVEKNLFASSDHANNVILYDTRGREVKKLKMTLRVNALEWNPMEAMILTAASEDYNCYSFDIRKMDDKNRVVGIYEGHTSAVIDLNYSPTGREFCTGSYDKSIRIFRVDESNSRDIYHTKRMFRVKCVLWSGDSKFILSGSSDHNVRIWKANASEKLGIMREREKAAMEYAEELKRKYAAFPEIKRIARHRHLPKALYHAKQELRIIKESKKRKEANLREHSKPGAVPFVAAKEKPVVGLQDDFSTVLPSASANADSDDDIS